MSRRQKKDSSKESPSYWYWCRKCHKGHSEEPLFSQHHDFLDEKIYYLVSLQQKETHQKEKQEKRDQIRIKRIELQERKRKLEFEWTEPLEGTSQGRLYVSFFTLSRFSSIYCHSIGKNSNENSIPLSMSPNR